MPYRVVFDTNVYISIFAFPERPIGRLLDLAIVRVFDLFVCPFILDEFKRIAGSKFLFTEKALLFFEDRIVAAATLIYSSEKVSVIATHEQDNRILECALEAQADFLVTGDRRHILPLRRFRHTRIVTPSDFLTTLAPH
jgi:putative PIN family toxin of toxin-antitoxin system